MDIIKRSDFVTVLSWVLILLSGLAIYNLILYFVVMENMFSFIANERSRVSTSQNYYSGFMTLFRAISFIVFIPALVTLYTSISMYKRKNWARVMTILLLLFIQFVLILGIAILIGLYTNDYSDISKYRSKIDPEVIQSTMRTVVMCWIILCVIISITIVYSIKKLLSKKIKAEFNSTRTEINMTEPSPSL